MTDYYDLFELSQWGTLTFIGSTPKTDLEALEISITKWQVIVDEGTNVSACGGPRTCGLCMLYNATLHRTDNDCLGCPIYRKTGQKYCGGTPNDLYDNAEADEEFQQAAQAELDFLIALKAELFPEVSA